MNVKKNGQLLSDTHYQLASLKRMTKQELIEEILGTHDWDYMLENGYVKIDPQACQGCGKPTNPKHPKNERGYFVNRTPADDGWLCGHCGGFECDECDKDIYVDCEVRIKEHGYNYHEECAIKMIQEKRLEECDIEWGMSEWALEEVRKEE